MISTYLEKGTRVRAKVRTLNGWKGTGTVAMGSFNGAMVWKDGGSEWLLANENSRLAGKEQP